MEVRMMVMITVAELLVVVVMTLVVMVAVFGQ